jgi:hypothetical protein
MRNYYSKIMNSLSKAVLPALAALLMAGCVTHPSASTVQPWPDAPPQGYAMLLMYRIPVGNPPAIYIDDVMAFKMNGNSYTWVYVKAGEHRFHTKWNFVLSGLNANRNFTFETGKSYYMKLLFSNDGNPYWMTIRSGIIEVPEEIARKEAATCWYRKPLVLEVNDAAEETAKNAITPPTASPRGTTTAAAKK